MAITTVTDQNFKEEVLTNQTTPVLVDFWAEWCGPCKMLAPVIDAMATKYDAKLKVCKLNTDDSPTTATDFQITGIPCCIVFKDGKEVDRIIGYKSESAFAEALDKHL